MFSYLIFDFRWPIMVLGPNCRISVDKNADECQVLDICVHPSVIEECIKDTSGNLFAELCLL